MLVLVVWGGGNTIRLENNIIIPVHVVKLVYAIKNELQLKNISSLTEVSGDFYKKSYTTNTAQFTHV